MSALCKKLTLYDQQKSRTDSRTGWPIMPTKRGEGDKLGQVGRNSRPIQGGYRVTYIEKCFYTSYALGHSGCYSSILKYKFTASL